MEKLFLRVNNGENTSSLSSNAVSILDAESMTADCVCENVSRTFEFDYEDSICLMSNKDTFKQFTEPVGFFNLDLEKFAETLSMTDKPERWLRVVSIKKCQITVENSAKRLKTVGIEFGKKIGGIHWGRFFSETKILLVTENSKKIITFETLLKNYSNRKVLAHIYLNPYWNKPYFSSCNSFDCIVVL